MPTFTDPAPCDIEEQLYECPACGHRICSDDAPRACPDCDEVMQNLSTPRPE